MRGAERWTKWLSAASLAALVSACAGAPHDASLPITDPNEQFNRGVLHVNQVVLDPPATVIKSVPGVIRDRFQDLDANLKEPRVFANDVLQGRFRAAGITVGRFIINTTFGIGGLFDCRRNGGNLPQQTGDFGQTLFVYGVPAGDLYRGALFRSLTRNAMDSAASSIRSAIPSAGWSAEYSSDGLGRSGRAPSGRRRSSRPVETGREFVGRLLQFLALELTISSAGRNCVRRKALPPEIRIAGDGGTGRPARDVTPRRRADRLRHPAASIRSYSVELA